MIASSALMSSCSKARVSSAIATWVAATASSDTEAAIRQSRLVSSWVCARRRRVSISWSGRGGLTLGEIAGGRRQGDERPGPDRLLHGVRDSHLAKVAVERILDAHPSPQPVDEVHRLDAIRIGERLERLGEQHLQAETQRMREPTNANQTGRGHTCTSPSMNSEAVQDLEPCGVVRCDGQKMRGSCPGTGGDEVTLTFGSGGRCGSYGGGE